MSLAKGKQQNRNHNLQAKEEGNNKKLIFIISGQKINICRKVKYLCITLEKNLEWNLHLKLRKSKLNRAISLLCKIRHYVPKFLLKVPYYTIFHSDLIYTCQI